MIFDSHAHYDDAQYDEDREAVLSHLADAGVDKVVNISNGWEDMLHTLQLIREYPFFFSSFILRKT